MKKQRLRTREAGTQDETAKQNNPTGREGRADRRWMAITGKERPGTGARFRDFRHALHGGAGTRLPHCFARPGRPAWIVADALFLAWYWDAVDGDGSQHERNVGREDSTATGRNDHSTFGRRIATGADAAPALRTSGNTTRNRTWKNSKEHCWHTGDCSRRFSPCAHRAADVAARLAARVSK